jgi:hypothetical protein
MSRGCAALTTKCRNCKSSARQLAVVVYLEGVKVCSQLANRPERCKRRRERVSGGVEAG